MKKLTTAICLMVLATGITSTAQAMGKAPAQDSAVVRPVRALATVVLAPVFVLPTALGPVDLEINSFRLKFDGGYFGVAVKTTHRSGDKLNFLADSQNADSFETILSIQVNGVDAVNSSAITLLDDVGVTISTYIATCQYSGICLLEYKFSDQYEAGVYQTHPDGNHTWTIRVTYKDGTHRDSKLIIDKCMSL